MKLPTLYRDCLHLIEAPGLASLGPESRAASFSIPELDRKLGEAFRELALTPALKDLFRGLIYLWHDHLDESHAISQAIETADGSLLHGMMHRREPDYGNAKYWFHRLGKHPSFLGLALKARDFLEKSAQGDLLSRICPNNSWDPFAFIDAVEDAREGVFQSKEDFLREVQRLETEAFLENLCSRL